MVSSSKGAGQRVGGDAKEVRKERHVVIFGWAFWWGEAAASDEEHAGELLAEWRVAVVDVARVLDEVVKGVSESHGHGNAAKKKAPSGATPAARTTRKRTAEETSTDSGKENTRPAVRSDNKGKGSKNRKEE
ncbi:hypothetical protein B0H12DRAFT_1071131 [Mycena haematopus]|nr:hypothetical protein B0H12DRAFT_1071131 [Mycena haematopus]